MQVKGWKWRLKRDLMVVVLGFVAVIIFNISMTCYDFFNTRWQEYGAPYPIWREYFGNSLLVNMRVRLARSGVSEDNWFYGFLTRWHYDIYERAMAKIPADDAERADYIMGYYIYPAVSRNKKMGSKQMEPFMTAVSLVMNNKSRVQNYNRFLKIEYVSKLYFIYQNNRKLIDERFPAFDFETLRREIIVDIRHLDNDLRIKYEDQVLFYYRNIFAIYSEHIENKECNDSLNKEYFNAADGWSEFKEFLIRINHMKNSDDNIIYIENNNKNITNYIDYYCR